MESSGPLAEVPKTITKYAEHIGLRVGITNKNPKEHFLYEDGGLKHT